MNTYHKFVVGMWEEKTRDFFGPLIPPSLLQAPPMLGGTGPIIDSGGRSLGQVSVGPSFPADGQAGKSLRLQGWLHTLLACYARQPPGLPRSGW